MKPKSIVLLSGGLDSTVNFRIALNKTDIVLALTFNYRQRAATKEIEAAEAICGLYNINHKVINLEWLGELTTTAIVNRRRKFPMINERQLDNLKITKRSAAAVWVPNRNAVFINIAAAFAESLGANLIIVGFNKEEGRTFPDNSKAFVDSINRLLKYSTTKPGDDKIKVVSYTQALSKAEIVKLGIKVGAPLEYIWACYEGIGAQQHCWRCESCLRLRRALMEAGYLEYFLENWHKT